MTRSERFEAVRPNGEVVVIDRDLDTGAQSIKVKGEAETADPKARRTKAPAFAVTE